MSGDQMRQGGEGMAETEGNARRDFLKKAGIAGAAAWTAPMILSNAAGAQGTNPVAPTFVAGSGTGGVTSGTWTGQPVTLTRPAAIQAGDLMFTLVAWHEDDEFTGSGIPAGWTQIGGTQTATGTRSVEGRLFYKVAATPITSEPSTYAWQRGFAILRGAMRVAMVAYRGGTVVIDSTTPQVNASEGATQNWAAGSGSGVGLRAVRIGAAGDNSSGTLSWSAYPATLAYNYNGDRNGARAIHFSDGTSLASASGTTSINRKSVTFTVVIDA